MRLAIIKRFEDYLEKKHYFGKVLFHYEDGQVVNLYTDNNLKEKDILELITEN